MPSALTTGSLTATGSVVHSKPLTDSLVVCALDGTYGTVAGVFEATVDGTNYFPVAAIRADTGALVSGSISLTDNSEVAYKLPAEGYAKVRFRVTAIASGTLGVTFQSSAYTAAPFVSVAQTGSSISASTFTGDVTLSGGSDLIVSGTTGQSEVHLTDNLADALSVKIASGNDYLVFDTTNSAEVLKAQVAKVRLADSSALTFGDADDISVAWDGTDLDVTQATTNSSIKWGVDGAGIDQVFYGDTASTNMTWDQSADSLVFTGVAYVVGDKTTCTAKTGDYTITAADSGKVLTTRGASGAVVFTLPTVAAGFTGTDVTLFNCVDQNMTISAQTAGQIMFKNDTAADSVAFSSAGEKIGAAARCVCDGTSWLVMPMAEEAVTITVT